MGEGRSDREEVLEEEVEKLKKRVASLEEEIRSVYEPLKNTILDIRTLMSELENPFNYLRQLGLSDEFLNAQNLDEKVEKIVDARLRHILDERINKALNRMVRPEKGEASQEGEGAENTPPHEQHEHQPPASKVKGDPEASPAISTLVCAEYLLHLFGKKNLPRILETYVSKRWISEEAKAAILKASKVLTNSGLTSKTYSGTFQGDLTDHLLAISLINTVSRSDAPNFYTLLLLKDRVKSPGNPLKPPLKASGRKHRERG